MSRLSAQRLDWTHKPGKVTWLRGDAESWTRATLYDGSVTDDTILSALGIAFDHYSGPGRAFGNTPYIKRTRTRAMLYESGGMDI